MFETLFNIDQNKSLVVGQYKDDEKLVICYKYGMYSNAGAQYIDNILSIIKYCKKQRAPLKELVIIVNCLCSIISKYQQNCDEIHNDDVLEAICYKFDEINGGKCRLEYITPAEYDYCDFFENSVSFTREEYNAQYNEILRQNNLTRA